MTAAAKGSVCAPMLITKDEATAAQRTVLFHLVKTADQTDATGLVPVVTLSKAGGAFGAAVGAVTELADGWYKIVLDAADVDTLGQLAMRAAVATADTLDVVHQVIALDLNTATVNPGAAGITSASFAAGAITATAIATDAIAAAELAAGAITEIQAGLATAAQVDAITLATRTVTKDLGTVDDSNGATAHTNSDDEYVGTSTLDCIDVTFQISGTWDSATATIQTTQDPTGVSPVWTDYVDEATDNPLTADGEVIVTGGGHVAARVNFTSIGAATDLQVTAVIRKPANT